jgi:uncharacterized RDD family membrane protein YckC
MNCPACGLINPPTAQICDCGYNFETQTQGKPIDNKSSIPLILDRIILPNGKEYVLAGLGNRWRGQLLDAVIAFVIAFCLVLPLRFLKSGDTAIATAYFIISIGYILFSDGFNGGRSFGKMVMKTAVIDAYDGNPCSYRQSVLRNVTQIIGFVDWAFIFGKKRQRLGDMAAGTLVVRYLK